MPRQGHIQNRLKSVQFSVTSFKFRTVCQFSWIETTKQLFVILGD